MQGREILAYKAAFTPEGALAGVCRKHEAATVPTAEDVAAEPAEALKERADWWG